MGKRWLRDATFESSHEMGAAAGWEDKNACLMTLGSRNTSQEPTAALSFHRPKTYQSHFSPSSSSPLSQYQYLLLPRINESTTKRRAPVLINDEHHGENAIQVAFKTGVSDIVLVSENRPSARRH